MINLLRHGCLPRENDGAIEFWRIKENLQKYFLYSFHWSGSKWKACLPRGGRNKKIYQYSTDSSRIILYFRALQNHSRRNLIDLSSQDNVLIPDGFFKYIYHVGCAINLHAIINSRLIPGSQIFCNRQKVFFLLVDLMVKEHKDLDTIDLGALQSCTAHAQSVEETSKHGVLGRHQTCSKERIEVLSDAIERHHSSRYTPSLLYPENCSNGNWRNYIRKSIHIISTTSKHFLET